VTTIVEFLTARYDEIEAAARAATPGPWGTNPQFDEGFVTDSDGSYLVYSEGTVDIPTAAHIALHDPAYVLADIAAKRKILEEHVPFRGEYDKITGCETCSYRDDWEELQVEMPCPTMRLLALPFADHPDYQGEWAP
jgi:Family of unknown function (DUF6221)